MVFTALLSARRRYDYAAAVSFLDNLSESLDDANEGASHELLRVLDIGAAHSDSKHATRMTNGSPVSRGHEDTEDVKKAPTSVRWRRRAADGRELLRPSGNGDRAKASGEIDREAGHVGRRSSGGLDKDTRISGRQRSMPAAFGQLQGVLRDVIPNLITRCKFREEDDDQMVVRGPYHACSPDAMCTQNGHLHTL